MISDIVVRWCL